VLGVLGVLRTLMSSVEGLGRVVVCFAELSGGVLPWMVGVLGVLGVLRTLESSVEGLGRVVVCFAELSGGSSLV